MNIQWPSGIFYFKSILSDSNNSKINIDSLKRKGAGPDPDWYTYEEITAKYGFTKDQIKYTLNHFEIRTEKRGKFTMIFRTDFDKAAAQRLAGAKKIETSNHHQS